MADATPTDDVDPAFAQILVKPLGDERAKRVQRNWRGPYGPDEPILALQPVETSSPQLPSHRKAGKERYRLSREEHGSTNRPTFFVLLRELTAQGMQALCRGIPPQRVIRVAIPPGAYQGLLHCLYRHRLTS